MKNFPIPTNEKQRLQAVYDYNLQEHDKDEELEVFANAASLICNAPIALVSIFDRCRFYISKETTIKGMIKKLKNLKRSLDLDDYRADLKRLDYFNVTEEFIHKALEFYFECGIA